MVTIATDKLFTFIHVTTYARSRYSAGSFIWIRSALALHLFSSFFLYQTSFQSWLFFLRQVRTRRQYIIVLSADNLRDILWTLFYEFQKPQIIVKDKKKTVLWIMWRGQTCFLFQTRTNWLHKISTSFNLEDRQANLNFTRRELFFEKRLEWIQKV